MSDQIENEWVWQGFYGSTSLAEAEKLAAEALPASVVGVIIPPPGQGVVAVDVDGDESMFAVQTRANNPLPVPDGMRVARPEIVGRMVGA